MKKMTKKLGAIVLALAMCFSLCCTALVTAADGDTFSITVTNAQVGQTYTAYKIFDATYDGNGNVAYSITSDNPWYQYVSRVQYTETVENDDGTVTTTTYYCPFTFTESGSVTTGEEPDTTTVTTYTVQVKVKDETTGELYSDVEIINYLNAILAQWTTTDADGNSTVNIPSDMEDTIKASEKATSETVVLNPDESGYYFVTSSLGSIVSITTADPDAYIIEKNNPPGNLEKVITDSTYGNGTHTDSDGDGDDVYFKVTANVPLYAPYDSSYEGKTSLEGYLVTDYEFTDTMSAGIDIEGLTTIEGATKDSDCDYYIVTDDTTGEIHYYATDKLIDTWITLKDSAGNEYKLTNVAYNIVLELFPTSEDKGEHVSDDEIYFDGFTLTYDTINMDVYAIIQEMYPEGFDTAYELIEAMNAYEPGSAIYPANAEIEIDYQAHMTGLSDYENTNDIDMTWHMTTYKNPHPDKDTPEYTGNGKDEDKVYVWELTILKVDSADTRKLLEGATFELSGTNLSSVVITDSEVWDPIENMNDYQAAVDADTTLYFQLESGEYTTVNPYELEAEDPNNETLANYEVNPYWNIQNPDDPNDHDYYGVGDYKYVAYTHTTAKSQTVVPAADEKVTGTTGESGEVTFKGLKQGTYTLTEITAPEGYNLLPDPITIVVTFDPENENANADGFVVNVTTGTGANAGYIDYEDGSIEITIENSTGTELPGTGGIGTTIFYIIGGVLVVGAVVVLVTRRRVNREA